MKNYNIYEDKSMIILNVFINFIKALKDYIYIIF